MHTDVRLISEFQLKLTSIVVISVDRDGIGHRRKLGLPFSLGFACNAANCKENSVSAREGGQPDASIQQLWLYSGG